MDNSQHLFESAKTYIWNKIWDRMNAKNNGHTAGVTIL